MRIKSVGHIIHPLLLSIFPILFLLSHNIDQITAGDVPQILTAGAVTAASTLLLWLMLNFIFKDKEKTALLMSLGLVLFFSFGHIDPLFRGIWKNLFIGSFMLGHYKVLLLTWGIIFLVGAYFIMRARRNFRTLNSLLSVVSAALLAVSLISIGAYALRSSTVPHDKITMENNADSTGVGLAQPPRDIYYIILDAYASSSTLNNIYGYDNHEFLDYLTAKGFVVPCQSHSNYMLTNLSLASSLNMEYINGLAEEVGENSRALTVPNQMILGNKVVSFLKSRGYKFIHYSSGWGPTESNPAADKNITYSKSIEFVNVLIHTTMLAPFMDYISVDSQRQIVLNTLSHIPDSATIPGPKFVFAHIICPHTPYIFDAMGKPVPGVQLLWDENVGEQEDLYVNQVIYLNTRVEKMVNDILQKSKTPPIIILQADHGTMATFYTGNGSWDSPTEGMLRERSGIFNAYYLPDGGKGILYDTITPVNTFRLVFNFYFGTHYDLLDDQSYYSTYTHPFSFTDITDKVRSGK